MKVGYIYGRVSWSIIEEGEVSGSMCVAETGNQWTTYEIFKLYVSMRHNAFGRVQPYKVELRCNPMGGPSHGFLVDSYAALMTLP